MMAPTAYDPNSPEEQPVPLPSAPQRNLGNGLVLQPPLSRRGTGPALVLFLPQPDNISISAHKPLDPEPVLKWAEEGFAVAAVAPSGDLPLSGILNQALDALGALDEVDIKEKFGVIVYDPALVFTASELVAQEPRVASFIGYGSFPSPSCTIPTFLHLTSNAPRPRNPPTPLTTQHTYSTTSAAFVLPQASQYDPGAAAHAHSRTLVFLRKYLGGPFFDLEAIWDEHTYFEFEARSVAKTMGTMVAEPYVNHLPTMTGGAGRANLEAFYRDHFIFSYVTNRRAYTLLPTSIRNPADATLQVVSRTVGSDRIVDEFVYHITHDRQVDMLLPGVPPTGKKLSIPMLAVVNIRGDRLYSEHIWWDQATVLRQAGILPSHLPMPSSQGGSVGLLRLPVAGVETANMLIDQSRGTSNEMFGPGWGITKAD